MTFPFSLVDALIVALLLWIALSERTKSAASPSPTSEPLHTRDMRAAMNAITKNAIDLSTASTKLVDLQQNIDQQTKALETLTRTVDAMDKTLFNVISTVYRDRLSRRGTTGEMQVGEERPGSRHHESPAGTTTSSVTFPQSSPADGFIDVPIPPESAPPTPAATPFSAHT